MQDVRSLFPYLESGRIYLNHAATGPWSTYVEDAVRRATEVFVRGDIEIYQSFLRVLGETRVLAGDMLGCAPERVAFVQNTSEGLNVLASGLAWKPGDRIVLAEQEFPANVYPFLNATRHGVELDFVPQRNGVIELADVERAIGPRTVLVALSWVQFLSGYTIDLKALSDLCAARNVLLSIDAIQGLGALRLDLRETPVDFLSAGVQKWQLAPQGVAVIYASERAQERIAQAHFGWLSVGHAWDFFDYRLAPRDDARRYENGTYNTVGIFGTHGSYSLFQRVGMENVERSVRALANHAYERIAEKGFPLLTPADPARRAGIVTFRHDRADAVAETLHTRGITVSARSGHIRIAPHFYNTTDEIDAAVEAIGVA
ncbi:MAG: aminotransferase class V-fold PLP-dependent enzyme [Ignavibacteriae bacterium]|nr:aminotransferase class V-fold PLP-dependent enzyme [Ignavibacteriota bacterium]